MGYMGFGMQSWIYKQRPRKPFEIKRKPLFTEVPKYQREFKIQPSKTSNRLYVVVSIVLISLFFGIIQLNKSKILQHSSEINNTTKQRLESENLEAFNLLKRSGKSRLKNNNLQGALSEFKLAYAIKSTDEELNQLLFETLSILCAENQKFCNELDKKF